MLFVLRHVRNVCCGQKRPIDLLLPQESGLLCPGKCLQQELHVVHGEETEETHQPQQNMAMSSLQNHKLLSSTFSGTTFSVFLAYIF